MCSTICIIAVDRFLYSATESVTDNEEPSHNGPLLTTKG
jgi:hypothetical protein